MGEGAVVAGEAQGKAGGMTLEERVSELERRVSELESHRLPVGWEYYPPLKGAPVPAGPNGGLSVVMTAEGYELKGRG